MRTHYFKPMIAVWESVETTFLSITTPIAAPGFTVKTLSTTGVVQRVITEGYHWIRIRVRKTKKNFSRSNIKRQPEHKAG